MFAFFEKSGSQGFSGWSLRAQLENYDYLTNTCKGRYTDIPYNFVDYMQYSSEFEENKSDLRKARI